VTEDVVVPPLAELRRRRSAKWRTYPADVLPLTVAESDVELAPPVRAALRAAIDRSDTGYSMAEPDLGRALAGFAGDRWGWDIDPGSVVAVTDVGVGVVQLLRGLTRPGDVVAFSPPVYPPFFDWVPEAGARTLEVPLRHGAGGWRLDLDALERAFAGHPSVYVLCNPHNPVGRAHTGDELAALVDLARAYRITLVSDEIHSPLVLPGAEFTPLLSVPGAAEIAVSLLSASKAWNLAGLKCASVVTASDTMRRVVEGFPPDVRWRTGHLGVLASVAAYTEGGPWLDALLTMLGERRAQLDGLLRDRLPELRWHAPEATYLAWLDCSRLGTGADLRERFLERGRVALEPGAQYGRAGKDHVRLNFGTGAAILDEAVERMAKALTTP
jgi:cysteine-S-conjugate beta-lyase